MLVDHERERHAVDLIKETRILTALYPVEAPRMTRARCELIPESSGGVSHLVTRCIRRARLLDRGERMEWLCRGLASWFHHMGIDLLA